MSVEMAGRIEVQDPPEAEGRPATVPYTGIATFDGRQWSSLCTELDIASRGDTAQEAIAELVQAVREAVEFAAEEGVVAGEPVPADQLREFLLSSRAPYLAVKFYVG